MQTTPTIEQTRSSVEYRMPRPGVPERGVVDRVEQRSSRSYDYRSNRLSRSMEPPRVNGGTPDRAHLDRYVSVLNVNRRVGFNGLVYKPSLLSSCVFILDCKPCKFLI